MKESQVCRFEERWPDRVLGGLFFWIVLLVWLTTSLPLLYLSSLPLTYVRVASLQNWGGGGLWRWVVLLVCSVGLTHNQSTPPLFKLLAPYLCKGRKSAELRWRWTLPVAAAMAVGVWKVPATAEKYSAPTDRPVWIHSVRQHVNTEQMV